MAAYRIQDTKGFTVDTVEGNDEQQAVAWASRRYNRTDLVAIPLAPKPERKPLTDEQIEMLAAMDAANAAAAGHSNDGDWDN